MHINRNTAAIIHHGDTVIRINGNLYGIAKTRQRFINTVIYNFRYQMMQTAAGYAANIHTGTFPYSFQPFQNLDLAGTVLSFHTSSFLDFLFNFYLSGFFCSADFLRIITCLQHCFIIFSHCFLRYYKLSFDLPVFVK